MGLFKKKTVIDETKCKNCGLELHDSERLKRHMKKAHGNLPVKKMDPNNSEGSLW
ncbi:MAG: hypothetical protein HZA84_06465 [Thaumarchaeota archaeon]|nr:hypothetical protein [Nitrososphaerota archaeon]